MPCTTVYKGETKTISGTFADDDLPDQVIFTFTPVGGTAQVYSYDEGEGGGKVDAAHDGVLTRTTPTGEVAYAVDFTFSVAGIWTVTRHYSDSAGDDQLTPVTYDVLRAEARVTLTDPEGVTPDS